MKPGISSTRVYSLYSPENNTLVSTCLQTKTTHKEEDTQSLWALPAPRSARCKGTCSHTLWNITRMILPHYPWSKAGVTWAAGQWCTGAPLQAPGPTPVCSPASSPRWPSHNHGSCSRAQWRTCTSTPSNEWSLELETMVRVNFTIIHGEGPY